MPEPKIDLVKDGNEYKLRVIVVGNVRGEDQAIEETATIQSLVDGLRAQAQARIQADIDNPPIPVEVPEQFQDAVAVREGTRASDLSSD